MILRLIELIRDMVSDTEPGLPLQSRTAAYRELWKRHGAHREHRAQAAGPRSQDGEQEPAPVLYSPPKETAR